MNVLIYSRHFAPAIGGIHTYIRLLAQGLALHHATEELRVTLVTSTPRRDWDDSSLPFSVVRQPGLAALFRLHWQADVIHVAGPAMLPMLLGFLLDKPVVVEHSGYQACCPGGRLLDLRTGKVCPGHFMAGRYRECLNCNAKIMSRAESLRLLLATFPRRWLARRMARHVAPSLHVARLIALPRTVTIHHGVPVPAFPVSVEAPATPFCFGYVGRLVWEKGGHVLLRAAKILMDGGYDFRLKIIGDGPYRARLESLTDSLGLRSRTTFTGYLEGRALEQALRNVKATVMPSVCEEVAPVAAIEDMAQGRLLIGSDSGGLAEMLGDAGLKFVPGNAADLARQMRRVLDDPGLAKSMGDRAHQRAEGLFREERMVAEHASLYQELRG